MTEAQRYEQPSGRFDFSERARQILSSEPILSARDVEVKFTLRDRQLTAIRRCSLDLYDGETLAIVGESGSGKSVFTKLFVGMLDKNGTVTNGSILYEGRDLTKLSSEREWRGIRGRKIAMVTQDPMTSLNPLRKVGAQIREAVEVNQGVRGAAAKAEAIRLMEAVGIRDAERRYGMYPHEFSGGMRQRVVIAIAIACRPQILICDEPTTALDVTIQAQILELIRKIQRQYHMTIVYITHDLGVVANVADRVAVMYAGQIVEIGMADEIFYDPFHPYSWALLSALPQLGVKGERLPAIDGTPPNLFSAISGDSFAPRNRKALNIDFLEEPPLFDVTPTHQTRTWLMDPRAPKVERPDISGRLRRVRQTQEGYADTHTDDAAQKETLVELKDLQVTFGSGRRRFVAVDHVNLSIYRGETLALVGESGSGKTTIGRAIIRINPVSDGEVLFHGKRISGRIDKALDREVIRKMQMIFQDPMASLNERAKVDYIVSEGLINHHLYADDADRKAKVARALEEVGLLPEFASRFPHEFSGGQRQRIGIARSLIMEPEFIIADEPISALDVSIRAQVLNLLNELKKSRGLTYLFIAHDLSVVRFIADRIAVIHKGRIVELADSEELFRCPLHPYTKALLSAVPNPDPYLERTKRTITYDPSMHDYTKDKPQWMQLARNHFVFANQAERERYARELEATR